MTIPPPVVVLGPTASGKSDVAMNAATSLGNVHIVCADAMQVYRGMDIGTAKPTPQDQRTVVHYGLDVADPSERYTVARFLDDIEAARQQHRSESTRELIVGGTGLYLTALVDGLNMPGEWPEIRAQLESNPDTATLFEQLRELDIEATQKMEPNNRRRIIRALEVCLGSGRPFSSFGDGVASFPPTAIQQIGIRWHRDELRRRIADRVHLMVERGLFDEVRTLLSLPQPMSLTARQAIGYKEVIERLEGRWSEQEAIDAIILRTQQFAVRQERWYRRDPRIEWVEVRKDPIEEVTPRVLAALA